MMYLCAFLWLWSVLHTRATRGEVPRPAAPIGRTLAWAPIGLLLLLGCGPVRRAVIAAPPNTPAVTVCTPGTFACHENEPVFCHEAEGETRWWPVHPRHASGAPRRCATPCALNDAGVAYCPPIEGSEP